MLTLVSVLFFAANSLLNRMAIEFALIDPYSFAVVRVLSAVIGLFCIIKLSRGSIFPIQGNTKSGLALAGYIIAFSIAYQHLNSGVGALILFAVVQLTMITASILVSREIKSTELIGAILALVGFCYFLTPSSNFNAPFSIMAMMFSGACWALYSLWGQSIATPVAHTMGNFIRCMPVIIFVCLLNYKSIDFTIAGFLLAVLSGLVCSGVGYSIWYFVLNHINTVQAATVQLLVPIFAALLGWMLLDEYLSAKFYVSTFLVGSGVVVISYSKYTLLKK